jgi:hypothetical protein
MVIVIMERDRIEHADGLTGQSETARESRSGLPGLGGRPSLHPAWSERPYGQAFGKINAANKTPGDKADAALLKKTAGA